MNSNRDIAMCIILTIITCGIYGIYWLVMLVDETNAAANEPDTSGVGVFLLSLITCGIFGIYWTYRMGKKINTAWQIRGKNADPNLAVLYVVFSVFGLGIVSYALIQGELNEMSKV